MTDTRPEARVGAGMVCRVRCDVCGAVNGAATIPPLTAGSGWIDWGKHRFEYPCKTCGERTAHYFSSE